MLHAREGLVELILQQFIFMNDLQKKALGNRGLFLWAELVNAKLKVLRMAKM
jgi:hypothetical protein